MLSFGAQTVADGSYTQDLPITAITLPKASGSESCAPIAYAVIGLPTSLTFDTATSKITGVVTDIAGDYATTYRATGADGVTTAELTFTVTVLAPEAVEVGQLQEVSASSMSGLSAPGPLSQDSTSGSGDTSEAGLSWHWWLLLLLALAGSSPLLVYRKYFMRRLRKMATR